MSHLQTASPPPAEEIPHSPGVPPTSPPPNRVRRPSCTFAESEHPRSGLAKPRRRSLRSLPSLDSPSLRDADERTLGEETDSESTFIPLDEVLTREEEAITRYGGNDPEDPPARDPITRSLSIRSAVSEGKDRNQVEWDGPDDPHNPQNWSTRRKWFITFLCILASINVTFASSAPSSAVGGLIVQFQIGREVAELITTMFLLGYCIGPLFWGPGSELFGRRPVFVVAMLSYTLLILGQSLAQNVQTLLVTRFFSGFFACAPLTNSGGVMADIWAAEIRGFAVSLFSASVFLGPVLGPIVSGYIVESYLSWRWVFWVMMIFAGFCTAIMIPFFPETCVPVILLKKARRLRKENPEKNKDLYAEHERQDWSMKGILHRTLFRPFKMLAMEPILVLVTVYLSLVYGLLYALFSAFPVIFIGTRGFTIAQTGLVFIGVGIGTSIGAIVNVITSLHYPELIKKWKGFPPPENRLFSAMIGSPTLVIGAFWLGWTGQYSSIPWYVPAISTVVVGAGISMIFMSFLTYLVDTYLMYAASALAANTVVRSAVAAGFPLFTTQMFNNLGINWACTLVALISLVFMPSPFLFYKYGPRIREKSTFAPCVDLVVAKAMKEEAQKKAEGGDLQETLV
ncbi:multidrug transporter [Coprinopsis cinerea okayama7|uniref:Multidrug transporter n=1 Tax=Coprinopsis cinerea (strain Okayama-7 / 130 / ATCC MYA-4618 / FGSC 9003) TaxID=240176 RepID=A8NP10_COPC7|nr:multidrug transporter [Coprinopsis cinerea okayama7\|eukprot:XP_001835240.2 multidrug transporter [Coprinopsis cinerea okayama7\